MRGTLALAPALALALVAVCIAPAFADPACPSHITVAGRRALPFVEPPRVAASAGVCAFVQGYGTIDDHWIPSQSDEIVIEVRVDLGPANTTTVAVLDGLTFANQSQTLFRVHQDFPSEWRYVTLAPIPIPGGAVTSGTLDVTVADINETVVYRVTPSS